MVYGNQTLIKPLSTEACHRSTLTLLVAAISANDAYGTIAANDLAVSAHFLYRGTNFHHFLSKINRLAWTQLSPVLP
jgi:hypothetical protein